MGVGKVKHNWIEFFEGDNTRLSMSRLLCFMSFFPASYVVVANGGEGALGWYLGAYVLGYVGGKVADVSTRRTTQEEKTNDPS